MSVLENVSTQFFIRPATLAAPSPALSGLVIGYDLHPPCETRPVLRDYVSISLTRRGSLVTGPDSAARTVDLATDHILTIRLSALGWTQFMRKDCSLLVDCNAPLEQINPALAAKFEEAANTCGDGDMLRKRVDTLLLRHLAAKTWHRDLPLVSRISGLIAHPDLNRIDDMCDLLGLDHARLARLCRRAFGFSPKFLMRRQRLQSMVAELDRRAYAEWRQFLDPRYVDQSHFIRDFRDFYGMAPTQYLARRDGAVDDYALAA
jgi:AraC-like DNA-binding protein